MVNIELYRVFYVVAKCGSLTKAAEMLYISQPAVSQAIKQLEHQLGVELFHRTHRGMELSATGGKVIFKQVEEALSLLDNIENTLAEFKTTATGTIRIGATDSIFSHILADKIVQFHNKYPGVRFDLITGTSLDTLSQLKNNKVDIGFINLPIEDSDLVFTGSVAHLSDIFVAGKAYEELKDKMIPLKELERYPLLMIEENTVARRALKQFTDSLGLHFRPDIEVANWDLMMTLAKNGMGVGCVPREYAKQFLDSGELFELKVVPQLPVRGVGVTLAKHTQVTFALREFMKLFN